MALGILLLIVLSSPEWSRGGFIWEVTAPSFFFDEIFSGDFSKIFLMESDRNRPFFHFSRAARRSLAVRVKLLKTGIQTEIYIRMQTSRPSRGVYELLWS